MHSLGFMVSVHFMYILLDLLYLGWMEPGHYERVEDEPEVLITAVQLLSR